MANWLVFLCLLLVSLPGIVVTVPSAVKSMEDRIKESARPGRKIPSMKVVVVLGILQSIILVMVADAAGSITTPLIGFSAPFFEALVTGRNIWASLEPQLVPSLVLGMGGGAVFVALYYLVFRPRLDEQTVKAMEKLRMDLGLSGRILYGGIAEEILTRFVIRNWISHSSDIFSPKLAARALSSVLRLSNYWVRIFHSYQDDDNASYPEVQFQLFTES
jgi:hypothetical protein